MPINQPLVSILMNCYNSDTYLRQAIDSVYAQTYDNWEIIFWDNVSTDQSANIAKSYDDKVKYFRGNETIPLYAARNKAIEQCQGDYVAFLDCDDLWTPDKLAKQIACFETTDVDLVYTSFKHIDINGLVIKDAHVKNRVSVRSVDLIKNYNIGVLTAMVKRSVFHAHGFQFSEALNFAGDFCLFHILATKFNVRSMSDYTAFYRVCDDSVTKMTSAESKIIEYDLIAAETKDYLMFADWQTFCSKLAYMKDALRIKEAIIANQFARVRSLSFKYVFSNYKMALVFFACLGPKCIARSLFKKINQ